MKHKDPTRFARPSDVDELDEWYLRDSNCPSRADLTVFAATWLLIISAVALELASK